MKTILVVLFGIFIRLCMYQFPHSGKYNAPKLGDFEAQRHWISLTWNLPSADWYRQTDRNDLEYWGLDYPPLTAYHSLFMGWIADVMGGFIGEPFVNQMLDLEYGKGMQDWKTVYFMRTTVLVCDLIFLVGPVLFLASCLPKIQGNVLALLFLLQPTFIIIDNGHFQYNNVCIGLFFYSVGFLLKDRILIASFLFTLSLNYKIMALYFALPYFSYLLGLCLREKTWNKAIGMLMNIAAVVLLTFFFVWLPLFTSWTHVIKRIFPFSRGLYEDYVSNFWCVFHPVVKKIIQAVPQIEFHFPKICALATLLSSLPAMVYLGRYPTKTHFLYGLGISSISFYIFSFHVHEKTILFPQSALLLIALVDSNVLTYTPHISLLSMFSMRRLFDIDVLIIPYLALSILYLNCLYFVRVGRSKATSAYVLCIIMVIWELFQTFVSPPSSLPYLWTYIVVTLCFVGFVLVQGLLYVSLFSRPEITNANLSGMKLKFQ